MACKWQCTAALVGTASAGMCSLNELMPGPPRCFLDLDSNSFGEGPLGTQLARAIRCTTFTDSATCTPEDGCGWQTMDPSSGGQCMPTALSHEVNENLLRAILSDMSESASRFESCFPHNPSVDHSVRNILQKMTTCSSLADADCASETCQMTTDDETNTMGEAARSCEPTPNDACRAIATESECANIATTCEADGHPMTAGGSGTTTSTVRRLLGLSITTMAQDPLIGLLVLGSSIAQSSDSCYMEQLVGMAPGWDDRYGAALNCAGSFSDETSCSASDACRWGRDSCQPSMAPLLGDGCPLRDYAVCYDQADAEACGTISQCEWQNPLNPLGPRGCRVKLIDFASSMTDSFISGGELSLLAAYAAAAQHCMTQSPETCSSVSYDALPEGAVSLISSANGNGSSSSNTMWIIVGGCVAVLALGACLFFSGIFSSDNKSNHNKVYGMEMGQKK